MKVRVTVELVRDEVVKPGAAPVFAVRGRTVDRLCVCDSWLSAESPRMQFDVEMPSHRRGLVVGIGDAPMVL